MGSLIIYIALTSGLAGSLLARIDINNQFTTATQFGDSRMADLRLNITNEIFHNSSLYSVGVNNSLKQNTVKGSSDNDTYRKLFSSSHNTDKTSGSKNLTSERHNHLREERSELSYDYDQSELNYETRESGASNDSSSLGDYKNVQSGFQIRHENNDQRFRTLNKHKISLKILSHTVSRNDSFVNKNTSETSKKQLGSVDMIIPSLEDIKFTISNKFGHNNISKIDLNKGVPRSNRTGIQIIGKTDSPMLNYIFDTHSSLNKHHHRNDRFGGPKIETPGSTVAVDTEQDAILDCKVTSLQDKLVSWLRRRPESETPEILTIGLQAYTADTRITVDFLVPNTWRLYLRKAVPSDSGIYECQLSTHPPMLSRHELIVHAPQIEIVEGDGDKYYERNSTLELECRIRHIFTTGVTWYHQTRNLNDDIIRGGINVKTETVTSGADSLLQVARLTAGDAGKYTCSVKDGLQASINVHVLNGESLAELQQTAGSPPGPAPSLLLLSLVILIESLCLIDNTTLSSHQIETRVMQNNNKQHPTTLIIHNNVFILSGVAIVLVLISTSYLQSFEQICTVFVS